MKVWVLEWLDTDNIQTNCTIWATEQDALQQACDELIEHHVDNWDPDDPDQAVAADQIQEFIRKGQYRQAVQRFNDYQDDYNSDYAHYYYVHEKEVLSHNQNNSPTLPPPAPVAFKASSPGATCRKCSNPNPYAYADRSDGTYCCRQCSTFSTIFGVSP